MNNKNLSRKMRRVLDVVEGLTPLQPVNRESDTGRKLYFQASRWQQKTPYRFSNWYNVTGYNLKTLNALRNRKMIKFVETDDGLRFAVRIHTITPDMVTAWFYDPEIYPFGYATLTDGNSEWQYYRFGKQDEPMLAQWFIDHMSEFDADSKLPFDDTNKLWRGISDYEIFGFDSFGSGNTTYEKLVRILRDPETVVHIAKIDSNNYGEYLFITVSRTRYGKTGTLTFWGLGYHDLRERWVINFEYYAGNGRYEREKSHPKRDALKMLHQRYNEILPHYESNRKTPMSERAELFNLLADVGDDDGAATFLEDMGL